MTCIGASKGTEGFGPALDKRLSEDDLEHLDVNPHIQRMVHTYWLLAQRPSLAPYRLWHWAHMLGYRGHWSTKSRRYSTTMTAIRQERAHHGAEKHGQIAYLEQHDPTNHLATVVLGQWRYAGSGYRTAGDALLAGSAAAAAREYRQVLREELSTNVGFNPAAS